MVTKGTGAYADLYSTVSDILRTHNADGDEVAYGAADALLPMSEIALDESNYQKDRYYNIEQKYVLDDSDDFDDTKTYFQNDPEATDGKSEVTLTASTYKKNMFYTLEDICVLCQDEAFNSSKTYYESDTITSLDELFSYMADIAKIEPKLTRLPLDEPFFEIQPNTRTINIPTEFAKNGISVQGDQIAEVLYFKVPRYFDATDLYMQQILIQWKNGTEEGVSKPWIIDAESEKGYIIFGWPISDRITKKQGTVEFSVRFYTYNKDEDVGKRIRYSLATQNASVTIKPSLNLAIEEILNTDEGALDYDTGVISDRFVNSPLLDGSASAEAPTFVVGLTSQTQVPYTFDGASGKRILNLGEDENGFRTLPITLEVSAMNTDGGQITYNWKKWTLDGIVKSSELAPETKYIATSDTTRVDNKVYYTYTGDVPAIYTGTLAEAKDAGTTIYEKFSTVVIDSVGRYTVYANNRVKNSTAETQDPAGVIEVPAPTTPIIDTTKAAFLERATLEPDDYVATIKDNHKAQDDGKLTYQWERSIDNVTFEEIEGATNSDLEIVGCNSEKVVEIDADKVATGDGFYKVTVTNNLNKLEAETTSSVCRVTHLPAKPTFSHGCTDDMENIKPVDYGDYEGYLGQTLFVKVDTDALINAGESHRVDGEDSITYQWYKYYIGAGHGWEADQADALAGTYVVSGDSPITGATADHFTPDDPDFYYFCEVSNNYNNKTAKKCTGFFKVSRM